MNKRFIRSNLTTKASEIKAAKSYGLIYSLTEAHSFVKYVPGTPSDDCLTENVLCFFGRLANRCLAVMASRALATQSKTSFEELITCFTRPHGC